MKKIIIVAVLALAFNVKATAQEFIYSVGFNVPSGDQSEFISLGIYADLGAVWEVGDEIYVGPQIGYQQYLADELFNDFTFLPIQVTGRKMFGSFFLGADLGYAVGLTEGLDGGLYYKPKAGVILGAFGIVAGYSGIVNDGSTLNAFNLGLEYGIF